MFKAPFSFSGRITRTEYFLSGMLFFFLLGLAGVIMTEARHEGLGMIGGILIIPAVWFILAQGWKRSNDAGWHGIVGAIPYVNFVLLFVSGDEGANLYGLNPRLGGAQGAAMRPNPPIHTAPLPDAWERARRSDEPKFRTISFKCGACGAQNANLEYEGTACCQFCGAPKD